MAADAPVPEKQQPPAKTGDHLANAVGAAFGGAGFVQSLDQKAAADYGKGAKLSGDLPSSDDLLKQIAADKKSGASQMDRMPFKQEAEIAKGLKPEELQKIGAIVDAIKNRNYDHESKNPESLHNLVAGTKPAELEKLKDMVNIELERKGMAGTYQVDVKGYKDAKGADQAGLLVSNRKTETSVGFNTEGEKDKKKLNALFNFIYD